MKHLAEGILQLPNGLYYFSARRVAELLRSSGLSPDLAAMAVGSLIAKALEAEERHAANCSETEHNGGHQ